MSKIRSKWTLQEKEVHNFLKSRKVKHKLHPKMDGNPDVILSEKSIVIFLDGCFWHKCPKHFKEPKTRKKYWIPKLKRNSERDRESSTKLRKEGFKVVRIWEHEVKDETYKKKLLRLLNV